jgi:predicted dehydrogenase
LLADPDTTAVVVATRHASHAELASRALAAGKHVFVEKPLAIDLATLERVRRLRSAGSAPLPVLTVGFNRRFAPLAIEMKRLVDAKQGPKCAIYTVSAGSVPAEHWTQRPDVGGGRIIGEACHFIDFLRWLLASPIDRWQVQAVTERGSPRDDHASIALAFSDGSIATVHYFANGGRVFPKERLEIFADDAVLRLDNFRKLQSLGWRGATSRRAWRQDKGHSGLVRAFVAAFTSGAPQPIPDDELFESSRVAIECANALRAARPEGAGAQGR